MDHRLYFALGDVLANIAIGAVVGLICWAIVSPSWNMWIAMLAMMPLGSIVGLLLFFPIGIKLGAMEVMVPLMFTGELSGMVTGMAAAMVAMSARDALLLGAASGLGGILAIWIVNSLLRGVTREAEGA